MTERQREFDRRELLRYMEMQKPQPIIVKKIVYRLTIIALCFLGIYLLSFGK